MLSIINRFYLNALVGHTVISLVFLPYHFHCSKYRGGRVSPPRGPPWATS